MMELAINRIKKYSDFVELVYVQPKIILEEKDYEKENFIYDIKERYFAEYLKYLFYSNKYEMSQIYSFIKNEKEELNYDLVMARLLLPTHYFFYFEKLIIDGDDTGLKKVIERVDEYEIYVNLIVKEINKVYHKKIVSPF